MRTGWYNFLVFLGTVGAWWSWGVVLTSYHPATAGILGFAYFYAGFFFAITGTLYLGGYLLQAKIISRHSPARCVRAATRQALLFATLLVIALFLQGQRLLTWYTALAIILLLTFLELLFVSQERRGIAAHE